ncbi:helix-turn-helix transcriptional regulator [Actinomadura sp. LOL_016]|uniref:helix-turn-helix transcriptional regulator n=1 Tax=unclassified Actinomadura TaxID=2626254 RepID=UPI003A7FCF1B
MSLSYLHRVFQADGTTVAGWIRRRRLERARRDLADPALHDLPVGRIAARWGFTHPAVFTRAFRAAYDVTPSEYRRTSR